MPVISISLTRELLENLDNFVKSRGYSSRSEAIRDAVREMLSEYELSIFEKGEVIATITIISEIEKRDVNERIMRLRHEYNNIITGNMHFHLGEIYCLEIFIARGDFEEVLNLIGRIRAIKGIYQVKYTLVPISD
ncbi:MAG: nickel-responsive transcriptional regulator NikR [Thermoprotei archaeon]|nr:MAG: nickel-responsive transcriptional regulator NikR [Thermoprotei archaeon]RLE68701.1 MAG: nickel-responsive transcriptional regulator NikR [Thermoprotei archaeon]